ncbi:uncharacterized protein LOC124687826 [Lolium rigidum]|uniref:uncharacterized protein LOC124687826 n=1 Tax=Lolium rigidum TaxID=89674 RepID=UPI001F5C65F4|nr:uncharacterized protein LOC124687826 [Lolium rigidum]XP_047077518.1 uncharacterized protein LOC124687826 [Lolium rigidum]XP_047077519.1 uncharacterized protein LOC124687826 [Lolium rigidum]
MVSWKRVCSPKIVGGLGIKELVAFSRALRLRWLWFQWTEPERPWSGTEVPCDRVDKHLFSACTTIVLGNGDKCSFWYDRWLDGSAPQCIAPLLFQLDRRKNLLVKVALEGSKLMKGLERISSVEEMDQFFILWQKIQTVELSVGRSLRTAATRLNRLTSFNSKLDSLFLILAKSGKLKLNQKSSSIADCCCKTDFGLLTVYIDVACLRKIYVLCVIRFPSQLFTSPSFALSQRKIGKPFQAITLWLLPLALRQPPSAVGGEGSGS